MGQISVRDIAGGADTTEQGFALWSAMVDALRVSDQVVVSFAGVSVATSSFANVSFVRLLEILPFDEIKRRVRVVDASRQIGEMIRSRVQREASADQAA